MTRLQIRDLIRKTLGETTAAFWSDTQLNTWIDDGCDDLAYRTKCIKGSADFTPVAETAEYTLSTYFPTAIALLEVYHYRDASTWHKLDPINRTDLDVEFPGWKSADSGTPTHYYWDREEDLFGLYLKPDSTNAGTDYCEVFYAEAHTALASDSTTPDISLYLQPAIVDFVVARGQDSRGWIDKSNDRWQKYFSKIKDYQIERHREREDDDIIMKSYRNI